MSLGAPSVNTLINSSNCTVLGNTASGTALTVQQLGAGSVIAFSNASGGSNVFVMNNLGQVGIGTTSPIAPLSVFGNVGMTLSNTTSVNYQQTSVLGFNYGGGVGAGTRDSFRIVPVVVNRDNGAGPYYDYGAQSDLAFLRKTNNLYGGGANDQTYTEVMRLGGATGNVGIGTTSPGYTLQVNGSIGMVGGTTIPVTLPAIGSQTSYGITLAASGTWYTIISDARISATITGAIGQSDLTSTIFIATLYANGGANASMTLVTGSASNIRVSGTALQFLATSGSYGLVCGFTLLRHN